MSNIGIDVIKIGGLTRYNSEDLSVSDYFLILQSGSGENLYSKKSIFEDFIDYVTDIDNRRYTGSFTGSLKGISQGNFSGSFSGSLLSKNMIASGAFSGSLYGSLTSKNVVATGSFYGSKMYGSLIGNNLDLSGSFSGSLYGNFIGEESTIFGKFSGSSDLYGIKSSTLISKNVSSTGSFSGSIYGDFYSKNAGAYGDWSGSFRGSSNFTYVNITGTGNNFKGTKAKTELFRATGDMIATGSMTGINFKTRDSIPISYDGTVTNAVSASYVNISNIILPAKLIPENVYLWKYGDDSTTPSYPASGTGVIWQHTYDLDMGEDARTAGGLWLDFKIYVQIAMSTDDDPGDPITVDGWYNSGGPNTWLYKDYTNGNGVGNFNQSFGGDVDNDKNYPVWYHEATVPIIYKNNRKISLTVRKRCAGSRNYFNGRGDGRTYVTIKGRYYIP